ncbi:hypothetical protein [Streptomyces sp. URMC 124]|uniref:hypothetical protein n=1 Tax=Streptomyces sp. URMC 124 TaxID=3423405 RepID=UPI003F1DC025
MRAVVRVAVTAVVLGTCLGWGGAATADTGRAEAGASVTAPVKFELPDGWETRGPHGDDHCITTTAWGDSVCPGKPLL